MIVFLIAIIVADITLSTRLSGSTKFAIALLFVLMANNKSLTPRSWFLLSGSIIFGIILVYMFSFATSLDDLFYKLTDWGYISVCMAFLSLTRVSAYTRHEK